MFRVLPAISAFYVSCAFIACDAPPLPASGTAPAEVARPGKPADSLQQRQAAFLNRLREADPQQRTIDRAMLNANNELGLILDRSVEMDKIPALMKTMLGQMAREFPDQDLTVLAYTPAEPPAKSAPRGSTRKRAT